MVVAFVEFGPLGRLIPCTTECLESKIKNREWAKKKIENKLALMTRITSSSELSWGSWKWGMTFLRLYFRVLSGLCTSKQATVRNFGSVESTTAHGKNSWAFTLIHTTVFNSISGECKRHITSLVVFIVAVKTRRLWVYLKIWFDKSDSR
jgi:hypothetical protein